MNEHLIISSPSGSLYYDEFLSVSIRTLRNKNNMYSLGIDALTIEGYRSDEELNQIERDINNNIFDYKKSILFKLEYGMITNLKFKEQTIKVKDGNDEDTGGLLNLVTDGKSIILVNASISFELENEELFLCCKAEINPKSRHPILGAKSSLDLVAKVRSINNFSNIEELLFMAKKEVAESIRYQRLVSKLKGKKELVFPNIVGYEELPESIKPLNRKFTFSDSRNCWNLASKLVN